MRKGRRTIKRQVCEAYFKGIDGLGACDNNCQWYIAETLCPCSKEARELEGKMKGRGILTRDVNKIAKKMIGRGITLAELRLIPYIQYVMVNRQRIEIKHISPEEQKILAKWKIEGFVKEKGTSGLQITKEFWDFLCEILFESYVDYEVHKWIERKKR